MYVVIFNVYNYRCVLEICTQFHILSILVLNFPIGDFTF